MFRARLIIHERVRAVFQKSLDFARQTGTSGVAGSRSFWTPSYILGRGAVKDTYNLLGDGIRNLTRALAATAGHKKPEVWAGERSLYRYFGASLKGEESIDWDDSESRVAFLVGIVALCNVDGEFHAFEDICTHEFAYLSEGEFEGREIKCPATARSST